MKKSICIPFSGFYESAHDGLIDNEIEWLFSDRETGAPLEIPDEFYFTNYCPQETWIAYAREYLENFTAWLKSEFEIDINLEFEELISPREYNFTTDRIFARISLDDCKKLYELAAPLTLKNVIERRHSSRDGFYSFYSNDYDEWKEKPLESYDHNELETVLIATIETIGNDELDNLLDDWNIMESSLCNDVISDIVWDNMPENARAIVNVFDEKQGAA